MQGVLWLSSVETSEPVGIPLARIAMIEQKPLQEANVVAIFLDTGHEIRVMEQLEEVQRRVNALTVVP